jgi:hypothetical protein
MFVQRAVMQPASISLWGDQALEALVIDVVMVGQYDPDR